MSKAYLHEKKALGILDTEEFFVQLAMASGTMDQDTVRKVYNGMLQVLYTELRNKGHVRLPALCDFQLLLSRPKAIRNRHMGQTVLKDAFHQVRIRPLEVVRHYFKALDEGSQGRIFDPAEKLKNRTT